MPDLQFVPSQTIFLIALALIWAGLLFGGFIFGTRNAENTRRMPTWTRMGSSCTLVVIGWLWWIITRETPYATLSLWFAIGMTCGFIGDLFMAQLFPIKNYALGGIASFGIGHIAYIAGLINAGNTFALNNTTMQVITWIAWLIIALILWFLIVYRGSKKSFLHKAALPYALLLASTTGLAMGLALQHPAFILITIGAGLFLLSDLILATELFNGANWNYIGDVVWLTYGPGQMLIVLGIPLYLIVF